MKKTAGLLACLVLAGALYTLSGCATKDGIPADLIISGAMVVTVNPEMEVINQGSVVIRDGEILDVGPCAEVDSRYRPSKVIDARGKLVMPGLVNTHTHVPMTALRGYADDLPLKDWLEDNIWPAEAFEVTADHVYRSSRLAMAEMISSGTTTFNDMYFYEHQVARAAREAGLRAVVGETMIEPDSPDSPGPDIEFARAKELVEAYRDDPMVTVTIAPHSVYTCSKEFLEKCIAFAREHDIALHIHLAESREEVETVMDQYGMRPVEFLDSIGGLGERTICAHCVQLDESEITLIASRGAAVAFTIQSEMKLADGIPPLAAMLEAGLKLGMGTDGPASNNDLDMFEEMNNAALVAKALSGDPACADARTMVRMATLGGARVLGLDELVGSIEPGKRADLIIIGIDQPKHIPMYEPHSHIVYVIDGDDVETVLVDGRLVMLDREVLTVDVEEAVRDVREIALELDRTRPSR